MKAKDFDNLNGEVYLFTSGGKVELLENKNNIKQVTSDELFEFAFNKNNKNILPKSILTWVNLINNLVKK